MSRSYKHSGFIQDQSSKKHGKRFANKKVRRSVNIPSGKAYRKFYNSWDIADYILRARGVLSSEEQRPGRRLKKLRAGGDLSPWSWLDNNDINELWRDWSK